MAEFDGHYDGFIQDLQCLRESIDETRDGERNPDRIKLLKRMLIHIKSLAIAFGGMEEWAFAETLSEIRRLKSETEPIFSTLQFGPASGDRLVAQIHATVEEAMLHAILCGTKALLVGGLLLTMDESETDKLDRAGMKYAIRSDYVQAPERGIILRAVVNSVGPAPKFVPL